MEKKNRENSKRKELVPIVAGIFIIIFGIVFFYNDIGVLGNLILLALLVMFVPKGLLTFFKYKRIKMIEDMFPVFLQDLAEWQKSGLTLQEALKNASRVDYGKLTKEIKKMSVQLSWGIPLQEVLRRFSERMKESSVIRKSVEIIIESYNSGGNIEESIESISENISMIKELEKERKAMMIQHVMTIYIIYFVFLGIIVGLSKSLMPMLSIGSNGELVSFGFQDPCNICTKTSDPFCIACWTFNGISQLLFFGTGAEGYYRGLFFSMLIVQGIFSGLVCGQIGENSPSAGIKHSLILTLIGLGVFMILVRLGII